MISTLSFEVGALFFGKFEFVKFAVFFLQGIILASAVREAL